MNIGEKQWKREIYAKERPQVGRKKALVSPELGMAYVKAKEQRGKFAKKGAEQHLKGQVKKGEDFPRRKERGNHYEDGLRRPDIDRLGSSPQNQKTGTVANVALQVKEVKEPGYESTLT